MLNSREAEAEMAHTLLEEAKSKEAVANAEAKLAAAHAAEAKRRVHYFSRIFEVAEQNVTDAHLFLSLLESEQEKAGLKEPKRGRGKIPF
jgi:DNA-binding protein H-NS